MLKSFVGKVTVINRWLGYLGRTDIEITSLEEQVLPHILEYFDTFSIVTKILEGSKYSTINLAIILLEEIKSQMLQKKRKVFELDISDDFKNDLFSMYEITLNSLKTRFSITDEMIIGTMLDPIFQDCDFIQKYLDQRNQSRSSFLRMMFNKYVGNESNSVQDTAPIQKRSFLQNLAKKYSRNFSLSSLEDEIERFSTIHNYKDDDLLSWWSFVGRHQFPHLAKLARIILQLSATSATVERLNSIAGATLSKYRLHMNHIKAEKIMFVFYNYPHVTNHFNVKN